MLKELLFKDDLAVKVIDGTKSVTSRLFSNLTAGDTFYVEDHLFVVNEVERKRIEDVNPVEEGFVFSEQLLDVLNEIYFVNLKRVSRELTMDDTMWVIKYSRVNIVR